MNNSNGAGFIKLSRNPEVGDLIHYPIAFALLTQVALRARRSGQKFNLHNLSVGQALIGDRQSIGASEQNYRTAKEQLEKWGFATFQPTNKGTIASLTDTRVFDINIERDNNPSNDPANNSTTFQTTSPLTTKKKSKKAISEESKEGHDTTDTVIPIPEGYSDAAKAVIALWNDVAVTAGLNFLPVDKFTDAVEKAVDPFSDPEEARELFEWCVAQEREKASRLRKTIVRVLKDVVTGEGFFANYHYEKSAHLAPDDDEIPF